MHKQLKACDCHSYNQNNNGKPNVILTVPADILAYTDGRETVCIDACIADVIKELWARHMPTINNCCGHGKWKPQIIIPQDIEPNGYLDALSEIDADRDWVVSRWERVEYTAQEQK